LLPRCLHGVKRQLSEAKVREGGQSACGEQQGGSLDPTCSLRVDGKRNCQMNRRERNRTCHSNSSFNFQFEWKSLEKWSNLISADSNKSGVVSLFKRKRKRKRKRENNWMKESSLITVRESFPFSASSVRRMNGDACRELFWKKVCRRAVSSLMREEVTNLEAFI